MPRSWLTDDWAGVVADPRINLVVELIGGTTTAREVVLKALRRGKPVVTVMPVMTKNNGGRQLTIPVEAGYDGSVFEVGALG